MKNKPTGPITPTQFRLGPVVLESLDLIADYLAREHGHERATRTDAVRYAVAEMRKKISKKMSDRVDTVATQG